MTSMEREERIASGSNASAYPKIRHEWYQTEEDVVISIMVKNTKNEDVTCQLGPRSVSIVYQLPEVGSEGCFELDPLSHEIITDQSTWKSFSSKIEVKLKKKVPGIKWNMIESETTGPEITLQDNGTTTQRDYPASARRKTNWDLLAKTAEKEEQEAINNTKDPNAGGDRAVNALFQQLYAGATDEQKKAMMKSYTESNGTALSTDWEDVKKKKVETKPPSSMVAKEWNK